ncbi:hypothetical protein AB0N73_13195 [Microbacterium sp. NPDC089189]|uniref:hypothetical protein n=1 Tax=Microbacterium sp. NPDC089189 TaxID=3154972 RepID=UPI0034184967
MSDGLSLSSGGAIAVDTVSLDAAAVAFAHLARRLTRAAVALDAAATRIRPLGYPMWQLDADVDARAVSDLADRARALCADLSTASATYELVELRATAALAEAGGDEVAAARAERRILALERAYPDAVAAADAAREGLARGANEVLRQMWAATALVGAGVAGVPLLLGIVLQALREGGAGRIPYGSRPTGAGTPGVLTPVATTGMPTGAPPGSLADAAARIPQSGDARVRIEWYVTAGGQRVAAVYISGTRSITGDDPWNMPSNADAYTGTESDALATVKAALAAAGVAPGDAVQLYGHSQGGMLAGQLAASGDYDVQVLGTFGSPTSADPGPGALSVEVRHLDDPVAALAGGGHTAQVGAADSLVAERLIDPLPSASDLSLGAHHLSEYAETAERMDASGDPRMGAVRTRLGQLADAQLVSVVEYGARLPASTPATTGVSRAASGAG